MTDYHLSIDIHYYYNIPYVLIPRNTHFAGSHVLSRHNNYRVPSIVFIETFRTPRTRLDQGLCADSKVGNCIGILMDVVVSQV